MLVVESNVLLVLHLILWVIVLVIGAAVLALTRQVGLIHQRIQPFGARMAHPGPALGEAVPQVEEYGLDGSRHTLGEPGRKTLLVFLSPSCRTCGELAPSLKSVARSERSWMQMMVIVDADGTSASEFAKAHGLHGIPTLAAPQIHAAYGVSATPFVIALDERARVATKGIVNHMEHLDSVIRALETGIDSEESKLDALASG